MVRGTASRLVRDGYSWLAAVEWAVEVTLHPRMNGTTLRVARQLAWHTVCRPGLAALVVRLRLKKRCVQYHLAALRETGLLVYELRGTRRKGAPALATVYRLAIPPAFDAAFEVRTAGHGPHRRIIGMSQAGRLRLGPYARRAARPRRKKIRPPRRIRPCTPIQNSSCSSPPAEPSTSPSDRKGSQATRTSNRTSRRAKGVRRRFQLAAELKSRVAWLGRTPVPRIAWAVQEVADAGWSAEAVVAWLQLQNPPPHIRRPSGFMMRRLAGASGIWVTAEQREAAIAAARHHSQNRARPADADRRAAATPSPSTAAAIGLALAEGRRRYAARQHATGLDDLLSAEPNRMWQPATRLWQQAAADVRAVLARPTPEAGR